MWCSREGILLTFYEIDIEHCLVSRHLWTDLYQTWFDAEHDRQFVSSLNELDVHSRSQGRRKARTCAVVLLKSCVKHDSWLCKGDDCEEVVYGDYGSYEHLLFLFIFIIVFFLLTFHSVPVFLPAYLPECFPETLFQSLRSLKWCSRKSNFQGQSILH